MKNRYSNIELPKQFYIPGQSSSTWHPNEVENYYSIDFKKLSEEEVYNYGIDLFNFGYWWECHEVFESLWLDKSLAKNKRDQLQSIILYAAALIKYLQKQPKPFKRLIQSSLAKSIDPIWKGQVKKFTQILELNFGQLSREELIENKEFPDL